MKRAVFLDLNGTLVMPIKVARPSELKEIPGSAEAVTRLSLAGYLCPVVTIQSRIGKGFFTEDDFRCWFNELQTSFSARNANLLGPYICPHLFETDCVCKKPKPFLYQIAAEEHCIDLKGSFVVGDTVADMQAARGIGAKGVFVRTGYGQSLEELERAKPFCDAVGSCLDDCVRWILTH
jgi:D-glycero-D-manno-heptose 1,7-bisphosphate phosphatase